VKTLDGREKGWEGFRVISISRILVEVSPGDGTAAVSPVRGWQHTGTSDEHGCYATMRFGSAGLCFSPLDGENRTEAYCHLGQSVALFRPFENSQKMKFRLFS
jgi:hypothetical protein